MKSEDNFFELFWANITSRIFNLKDAIRNCFLYWRDLQFAKIDLYLTMSYFFKSPYRISREFTNDEEPYGETPLHTMEVIAKAANLTKEDVVYELGFGRGRSCFWLSLFLQRGSVLLLLYTAERRAACRRPGYRLWHCQGIFCNCRR